MYLVEFYEHVLTELNKVEAPSLLLEDFNYFANKAVQQYINEVYNRYDINQQSTDDLSVLKTSHQEVVSETSSGEGQSFFPGESGGWCVKLPSDYLHMLNCIVTFDKPGSKCSTENSELHSMARRLTSDMYPSIIRNAYLKPSYRCPYYFINNTNYEVEANSAQKLANVLGISASETDGDPEKNTLRIEIRCGNAVPRRVYFDYIRKPNEIILEYEDLENFDKNDPKAKKLEFPEYVCYEIINRFVKLALENASDPRLETNLPINQTIAGISNNN